MQVCVYVATGTDQENRAYWYLVCRGPMKALPHRYQTILLMLIANQSVVVTLPSITRQSIERWASHILNFRHRASCILGQAFHYSPENAFYIFNQQMVAGNIVGALYHKL